MSEPDPQLARLQRDAVIACVLFAVAAAVSGSGVSGVAGVAAGGLLAWLSYRGISRGVDALVGAMTDRARVSGGAGGAAPLVKFITRYGILAFVAYVTMVRLRAHPAWMLAGATSFVAAAVVEALRQLRTRP